MSSRKSRKRLAAVQVTGNPFSSILVVMALKIIEKTSVFARAGYHES
jgi:hypothetical protein